MSKIGRPKKEIDAGIIFHMVKNSAPVRTIARFLGVHRDVKLNILEPTAHMTPKDLLFYD